MRLTAAIGRGRARLRRPCGVAAPLACLCLVLAACTGGHRSDDLRRSVFRIRNFAQNPDFSSPWKYSAGNSSFGTGFFIGNGRILTNAHVVSDARFITVQREDGLSMPATPVVIGHDADLAVLQVADAKFFDGLSPLRFGGVPSLRSPVYTIGFPLGGEKVSITEGGVSRIDYRLYVHTSYHRHLMVQVDSAINPGNSGGPVVQGDKVVGVAFQVNMAAQGTGYIIPTPVIERFLKDIEDGTYEGHPEDGLTVQENALANPRTAEFFGLAGRAAGVLVAHVAEYSPFFGQVRRGDVLVAINGHTIAPDGRVLFSGERVDFKIYYDLLQVGDVVTLTVMRDGQALDVPVTARKVSDHYTQARIFPVHADYLEYGGLVFEALSRNYLETFGEDWAERAPQALRFLQRFWEFVPEFGGKSSPVVLAARLPHAINAYIDVPVGSVVAKIDGEPVPSLAAMRDLLRRATGPLVVIEFWDSVNVAVLSRLAADAASADIARTYRVATSPKAPVEAAHDAAIGGSK